MWPDSMQIYWNKRKRFPSEKSSVPTGLVWNTNMAAVSLFWNTNMAALNPLFSHLPFKRLLITNILMITKNILKNSSFHELQDQ